MIVSVLHLRPAPFTRTMNLRKRHGFFRSVCALTQRNNDITSTTIAECRTAALAAYLNLDHFIIQTRSREKTRNKSSEIQVATESAVCHWLGALRRDSPQPNLPASDCRAAMDTGEQLKAGRWASRCFSFGWGREQNI